MATVLVHFSNALVLHRETAQLNFLNLPCLRLFNFLGAPTLRSYVFAVLSGLVFRAASHYVTWLMAPGAGPPVVRRWRQQACGVPGSLQHAYSASAWLHMKQAVIQ